MIEVSWETPDGDIYDISIGNRDLFLTLDAKLNGQGTALSFGAAAHLLAQALRDSQERCKKLEEELVDAKVSAG